jgi:hypothetical protein
VSTGVVFGLVALLVALWVLARTRRYGGSFADAHVLEVARGLVGVKAAALARPIRSQSDEPAGPADPRILATSAGLAIVYTVAESESGSRFVHHCSVSLVGAPTTHAVGGTFLLLVAKLLGLPREGLSCQITESTVHHAELALDAARHAAIAAAPVLAPLPAELAELRQEALNARASVAWERSPIQQSGSAA